MKNVIFQKSAKKINPYRGEAGNALQDVVPEGGTARRVIGFLQICTKRVFEKKVAKIKSPYYTTNPRCQKSDPPGGGPDPDCLVNFEKKL